jgi:hypothetical protein
MTMPINVTKPNPLPSAPDPAAHIRDLAYRVIGTDRGRDYWMTNPNPELGGKSPQDLIDDGHADVVERYLTAALEGDFG